MVKYAKPKVFYNEFTRRGPGEKNTTYCPGCGHGNAHKLIAEVIGELDIQDRVIFCSPVGCSVFAYYYFDTGNIQCSHGRAPAVATGVARTRENSIVISYQGDGDLAGIGMGAIMHAANRGEHMAVFFINNAIYGMTGGQMAPTTLIGQEATTAPGGRRKDRHGAPIDIARMLALTDGTVYVERRALTSAKEINRAKKAIRKAFRVQLDNLGFGLVELLGACPTNWKMTPKESMAWIENVLAKQYPLGVIKDETGYED
jgi:pyruvate/2-oxoacid:ferredoxin oxidoreductase beta subunit